MPPITSLITRFLLAAIVLLAASAARAASDTWKAATSGTWGTGSNWTDGSTPGNSDTATFNLAGSYTVTFSAAPAAIQSLLVSAGTPTFVSSVAVRTLNVTSATGGQDVTLSGTSTHLTLGASAGTAVVLVAGDDLHIENGATLTATAGSIVSAADLSASGMNGSLTFTGIGSQLTLTGAGADNYLGRNGGTGTLTLASSSAGHSIAGNLGIADSMVANSTGTVVISNGSFLTLTGNLTMANRNVTGQSAVLDIRGSGSALSQSGSSAVTVGAAANGTAAVNIGVASTGGALTTGSGAFVINPTGTVTVGAASNSGTLVSGGDLTVNGGTLQTGSAGTLTLATGKNLTALNNGQVSLNNNFSLQNGGTITVQSGADLTSTAPVNVGNGAGNGTVIVDGAGSSLSTQFVSVWGASGRTGSVTFRNGATGSLGGVDLAASNTAGTVGTFTVQSGASVAMSNLTIAINGGATTTGTVTVEAGSGGPASLQTIALTVGSAAPPTGGTAALHVNAGGTVTTGSGSPTLVNTSGLVDINGGTFNANGNVTITGGTLQCGPTGAFTLGDHQNLTAQSNAQISFPFYDINNGGTFTIQSGADLTTTGTFDVGNFSGDGTLVVDGAGSTVTSGSTADNFWAETGTASVTFRNNATGTFGNVYIGLGSAPGTNNPLSVQSGAAVTVNKLEATGPISINGGTLNVNDNITLYGGTLTQTTAAGSAFNWAANHTLSIQLGGKVTVVGIYSTPANAVINVTGAGSQFNQNLPSSGPAGLQIIDGAQLNLSSGGAVTQAGASTLTVGAAPGSTGTITINTGSSFSTGTGQTTINPTGLINVNGGAITFNGNVTAAANTLAGNGLKIFAAGNATIPALATTGSTTVLAPAHLSTGSINESSLTVSGTISLTPGSPAASTLASLLINPGGSFDLANNDLTIASIPTATLRQYLSAHQLFSTTADADAQNRLALGYSATAPTLVTLTYLGDANLDGRVNADDFALTDRGFAKHLSTWSDGDFNYDGTITSADYLLIDRVYVQQGAPLSPDFLSMRESQFGADYVSQLLTSIPEPSFLACLFAGLLPITRRRA